MTKRSWEFGQDREAIKGFLVGAAQEWFTSTSDEPGGLTTGVGGKPIGQAAKAGFVGGEAATAFRDNMRGAIPMEDVITDAKSALNEIKKTRSAAYNTAPAAVTQPARSGDRGLSDAPSPSATALRWFGRGMNTRMAQRLALSRATTINLSITLTAKAAGVSGP